MAPTWDQVNGLIVLLEGRGALSEISNSVIYFTWKNAFNVELCSRFCLDESGKRRMHSNRSLSGNFFLRDKGVCLCLY